MFYRIGEINMFCGYCGKSISNQAKFCPYCGRNLITSLVNNNYATKPSISVTQRKNQITIAVTTISIIFFVIIFAAIYAAVKTPSSTSIV